MNIYKWTVTIDGHEGPFTDDYEDALKRAQTYCGVLTEYEYQYTDSYVLKDYTVKEGES